MKQERSAKGTILANIRNALLRETPQPYPQADATEQMYVKEEEELDILFAKNFTSLQGNFVFCEDERELVENLAVLAENKKWNHLFCWDKPLQDLLINDNFKKCRIGKDLEKADAGITYCEALVARTGSALITSAQASGRTLAIFPPVHIIVAYTDQLVYDIQQAMQIVKSKYDTVPSMINLVTGPSRTADIEKTLVLGAHGPKEVYVFLIER